jgi:hypothetical protein
VFLRLLGGESHRPLRLPPPRVISKAATGASQGPSQQRTRPRQRRCIADMRTGLVDADERLAPPSTKMRFQPLKSHQDALPLSFGNELPGGQPGALRCASSEARSPQARGCTFSLKRCQIVLGSFRTLW